MNKITFMITFSFILLLASACNRSASDGTNEGKSAEAVTTKISLPEKLKAGGTMNLTMKIENGTKNDYKFLKWNSPFENNFLGDYLNIVDEKGAKVEYRGPMAKRMWPPPAEAYDIVVPGKFAESTIDISQAYPINLPGKYSVQYEGMNGADSIPASNKFEFIVQ